MSTKLIKEKSYDILNERLSLLRDKIYETFASDNKHFARNELIKEVQTIKLAFDDLKFIDIENVLFYLNYNTQFAMKKLRLLPYDQRKELINDLLKLDMSKEENVLGLSDFLLWAANYLFRDKDMAKLVKYFCDNTDYKNSNTIFDVYSVYLRFEDDSKCKKLIIDKHNEILQEQENKQKSRIIL